MKALPIAPSVSPLFGGLDLQPSDPLLSLISQHRTDPRPHKIDLGVGVYRDARGATPVLRAVKAAEAILVQQQPTKAYLGPEGDIGFLDLIRPIIFGGTKDREDLIAVQTPGGTGALKLAADLAQASRPGARIGLGLPTWVNHAPLFKQAGLHLETYRYFDPITQSVRFDEMMSALGRAEAGDLILLHGCCHNPTGADLDPDQWRAVAALISARGLTPLVDLAYQGLAEGLEADAAGLRQVMDGADVVLVAYSCDKNFGLYRERTGALFVRARGQEEVVRSNILALARCAWSMPPDHGAAVVRTILQYEDLTADWRAEVETMRLRVVAMRQALAKAYPPLASVAKQHGLFSVLPFSPPQVAAIRRLHAVYMAGSGRINLAGLNAQNLPAFVRALDACLTGAFA